MSKLLGQLIPKLILAAVLVLAYNLADGVLWGGVAVLAVLVVYSLLSEYLLAPASIILLDKLKYYGFGREYLEKKVDVLVRRADYLRGE